MINYIIITFSCMILLYYFLKFYLKSKSLEPIPRYKWFDPITGNIFPFVVKHIKSRKSKSESLFDAINELGSYFDGHDIAIFWRASNPVVIIRSYEYSLPVFSQVTKVDEYRFLKPLLGEGLITVDSEKWRHNRKLLAPCFSYRMLNHYFYIIEKHAIRFIEYLNEKRMENSANTHLNDVYHSISCLAVDLITDAGMGSELDSLHGENIDYVTSLRSCTKHMFARAFIPWHMNDMMFKLTPTGFQVNKDLRIINKFVDQVIEKRKKVLENLNDDLIKLKNIDLKSGRPFLDHLIMLNKKDSTLISDLQVKHEANTFMFAGADPISSTLAFMLHHVGYNKRLQDKIFDEIENVFPKDEKLDMSKLNELKLVEWTVKETLRLYPALVFVFRELSSELTIGDHQLPKGTSVFCSIYHMQRDRRIYSKPDDFIPERWEAIKSTKNYLPFSAGPRSCLGQKFAMIEMKTILAYICKHFIIKSKSPAEGDLKLGIEINLRPNVPVEIEFMTRNRE